MYDIKVVQDITAQLKKAKSVALCVSKIESFDKAVGLVAFALLLDAMGKKTRVLSAAKPKGRVKQLLNEFSVSVETTVEPLSYVISIDYGTSNIEKVTYDTDESEGKINFYIVPNDGGFDFDNVEFTQGGANFDLTVVMDLNDLKQMGNIYVANEYLFKENPIIAIGGQSTDFTEMHLEIPNNSSYSEAVYEIIKSNSDVVTENMMNVILCGILDKYRPIEGDDCERCWEVVASVTKFGGSMKYAMNKVYFSKTRSEWLLQLELTSKLREDRKNKIAISWVDYQTFKRYEPNGNYVDTKGRIGFNTTKEFDLIIVGYEIEEGVVKGVAESNNSRKFPADKVMAGFNAIGDSTQATFVNRGMSIEDLEKRISEVLAEYTEIGIQFVPIELTKNIEPKKTAGDAETLTKAPQYSKNDGLSKVSEENSKTQEDLELLN